MGSKEFIFSDFIKKWLPSVIILPVSVYLVLNRGHYTWIDNADLVIHEAGHIFFMFFGEFIHFAGGTLMQIILPSIIAWYFFRNMYRTGLQVSLLWLGQNFINISVYAADARARALPLLGGNKAGHDWHYMLGELNLLEYDHTAGYIFLGISILIFIAALLMPLLIKE
ncbi:MAG: hypothetical protein WAM24_00415 [Ignavibacteriaceae bacterium]